MHSNLLKQAYSAMRHDLRRTLLTMASVALARRMVAPIRQLQDGAARVGGMGSGNPVWYIEPPTACPTTSYDAR